MFLYTYVYGDENKDCIVWIYSKSSINFSFNFCSSIEWSLVKIQYMNEIARSVPADMARNITKLF
jgi:hypothetical protein